MIGNAIVELVRGISTITDVIGDNIFPQYVKEADSGGAFPQLVYEEKSAELPARGYTSGGGLVSVDVTITVVAKTYAEASNLARTVIGGVDNQSGTWASVVVQGIFFQDNTEDVETDQQTEEILYYLQSITFKVWFNL